MKKVAALAVVLLALLLGGAWGSKVAPSAGWTWDESTVAASSVSTLDTVTNITW